MLLTEVNHDLFSSKMQIIFAVVTREGIPATIVVTHELSTVIARSEFISDVIAFLRAEGLTLATERINASEQRHSIGMVNRLTTLLDIIHNRIMECYNRRTGRVDPCDLFKQEFQNAVLARL